jgi:hypothetical protein
MAEKRKKIGSVLLRFRGKTRNFDVFPAEQWPDQHGADLGLYRLCEYTWENGKRREKWFSFGGQKYTFITPEAMGQLVAKGLTEPGWLEALERPAPKFKAKDWVRWYGPQFSARQFRLRSDPFLWVDGQWRVLIEDLRLGRQLVCCDELVPLDRFGREVPR